MEAARAQFYWIRLMKVNSQRDPQRALLRNLGRSSYIGADCWQSPASWPAGSIAAKYSDSGAVRITQGLRTKGLQ
jgi:hypothetical protein